MLRSILVGIVLTSITVGFHAVGTTWWIRRLQRNELPGWGTHQIAGLKVLCQTAIALLLFHIIEVTVWAITYNLLPNLDQPDSFEEAVYFSMVTFTSLGYGDVVITARWRLLSGIQATAGLLIFGWSTAVLFAVVQRLWAAESAQNDSPNQG